MANTIIIPCPHCNQLNRLAADKRGEKGRCGKCGQPLFTGHPIALTEATFERQVGSNDLPVVVDCWASWCGPCRAMAPVFEAAAAEMEPHVRFTKVDTEAERNLAARLHIQAIPTLILFRGGREIARRSGAIPGGELKRWLTEHLAMA